MVQLPMINQSNYSITARRMCYDIEYIHCVSKKLPTFKLSVTSSNLNRFSKFLHCWKAYEICHKNRMALPTSPKACCYTTLRN